MKAFRFYTVTVAVQQGTDYTPKDENEVHLLLEELVRNENMFGEVPNIEIHAVKENDEQTRLDEILGLF